MTDICLIKVLIYTLNKPHRTSLLSLLPPSTPINPYSHCSPFLTMFPYSRNNCSLRAVPLLTRLCRQFSRTKPSLKRLKMSMGFLSCAMYLSKIRRTLVPLPYRMVNKQTCGRHGDKAPISWNAKKWRRNRGGCREWFIYSDQRTSTHNSRSVLRVF